MAGLSTRQRVEMAWLCVGYEDAMSAPAADEVAAAEPLIRYVAAEGIRPGQFTARERNTLSAGYCAAVELARLV